MDYKAVAKEIRKKIVRMAFEAKNSHVACALSCADVLTVLYFGVLTDKDKFILSKGHAASALYATLAQKGNFPESVLATYCKDGGQLPGHTTKDCVPGVEISTGSLGHGLPIGAGLALAAKHDKSGGRMFVLMSDGEVQEGSVWEAALFANQHKLDNLVAIVDLNRLQGLSPTKDILNLEPLEEKWRMFGWAVKTIDGHAYNEVEQALNKAGEENKPTIILAQTVNGKGVSYMEDRIEWHYKSPNEEEYNTAVADIEKA